VENNRERSRSGTPGGRKVVSYEELVAKYGEKKAQAKHKRNLRDRKKYKMRPKGGDSTPNSVAGKDKFGDSTPPTRGRGRPSSDKAFSGRNSQDYKRRKTRKILLAQCGGQNFDDFLLDMASPSVKATFKGGSNIIAKVKSLPKRNDHRLVATNELFHECTAPVVAGIMGLKKQTVRNYRSKAMQPKVDSSSVLKVKARSTGYERSSLVEPEQEFIKEHFKKWTYAKSGAASNLLYLWVPLEVVYRDYRQLMPLELMKSAFVKKLGTRCDDTGTSSDEPTKGSKGPNTNLVLTRMQR